MKTHSLLPAAVLDDLPVASVDRILSRSFWSEHVPGEAVVLSLEARRERRRCDPASGER